MRAVDLFSKVDCLEMHIDKDVIVSGISYDSRQVKPLDAYFALEGSKADGHDFIADALKKGATVVVGTKRQKLLQAKNWILVHNSRVALSQASSVFWRRPSDKLDIIGIVGTNGKTTTAFELESILQCAGFTTGLIGTVVYKVGPHKIKPSYTTPEAPLLEEVLSQMVSFGAKYVVMEVSSHAIALHRVDNIRFVYGVFTNLSQDHLDFHKTMEEYASVKKSFFTKLLPASREAIGAAVNIDDKLGREIASDCPLQVTNYSITQKADVWVERASIGSNGIVATIVTKNAKVEVESKLQGKHNLYNLTAAVAAASALGIDVQAIREGIASVTRVPGRMDPVPNPFGIKVWVDYSHTPDALRHAIESSKQLCNRLCVVFGAGGNRDRDKRPKMGNVACSLADYVIVTSDNPRYEDPIKIIEDILTGVPKELNHKVDVEPDRARAIRKALAWAEPGDGVLIAGKGHEDYQILGDKIIHFDDREEVEKAIRELSGAE